MAPREDDSWDDDEEEDPSDEFDDDATIPCPYCKRPIHEDAQRCPHCGQFISAEDAPASRRPWWIVIGVLLGLYAVYRWIGG